MPRPRPELRLLESVRRYFPTNQRRCIRTNPNLKTSLAFIRDQHEDTDMIFVAEYELTWENLEAAMAKRLDWDEVRPESFRFLGEYVWADYDPPFRGVAIFEADGVEDVNNFVLHYGPTLKMVTHAASDVVSAITGGRGGKPASSGKPKRTAKRRRR